MSSTIPLSIGGGEILAPQTLVTTLILSHDGTIQLDAGALHGRSLVESRCHFVRRSEELTGSPAQCWFVWVAVELDDQQRPFRYKGIAASEWWVEPATGRAYKSVAENVNRIDETLRGGINLKALNANARALIVQQLAALDPGAWARTGTALKEALGHA